MVKGVASQAGHEYRDVVGEKLNIGCGPDVRSEKEGWVNLDAYYEHPDVVKHDMADLPWPFEDNRFALVYASHVLEHIAPAPGKDPLIAVVEECHRVLQPGGMMVVRVPWGHTYASRAHIQHYRDFYPEHFMYFQPEHTEHYITKADFRVESWRRTGGGDTRDLLPHSFMIRNIPLTSHLWDRFPFLRPLLTERNELCVTMRKL